MSDIRETTWNHIQGEPTGTFYTDQRRHINKIHKLKEKHPNDVQIQHVNEDGSLVVHLPECWFRISPKKQSNMTQEQKDMARDRLAKNRKNIDHNSANTNNQKRKEGYEGSIGDK